MFLKQVLVGLSRPYLDLFSLYNLHSNIHTIMSDDEYQLQHRLRKMKAMTFSEQRQFKLTKRIFDVLASRTKQRLKKYDEYYNMILCIKSFKGFMEFAILKRKEEKQLQNQQRMREIQQMDMRNAKEEERVQRLIKDVECKKKARSFRKFCRVIKEEIRLREQRQFKESLQQKMKNQESIHKAIQQESAKRPVFAQTQAKFFKEDRSQIHLLENSRRSVSSAGYLTQDLQAKRKFAAIKALPPKPLISEVKEQKKQQREANKKEQFHRTEPFDNRNNEAKKERQINNPSKEGLNLPLPNPIFESPLDQSSLNQSPSAHPPSNRGSSNLQKQQSSPITLTKKDQILALLCQLKMVQILTLQGLIEQTTKSNKSQAHLIEKRHIKQSLAMLEKIAMLS